MASFTCLCGERINLAPIPNPVGFNIIPEKILEEVLETSLEQLTDRIKQLDNDTTAMDGFSKQLFLNFAHQNAPGILQSFECQSCNRIAVFARASDAKPAFWFSQDKANYEEIAGNLSGLVEKLRTKQLPQNWQEHHDAPESK